MTEFLRWSTQQKLQLDGKFEIVMTPVGPEIRNSSSGERIPDDEPLFLLRARDVFAHVMVRDYEEECVKGGCTDYHVRGIRKTVRDFSEFAADHPERMKQPGSTEGR